MKSCTLASIKPGISQALNSLLEEIHTSDDTRILCATVADDFRHSRLGGRPDPKPRTRQPHQDKVCPLCKQAGRFNTNYFLSQCTFLPDNDRRFMVKARQIVGILDDEQVTDCNLDPDPPCPETTLPTPDVVAYHVQTRQSPYMDVFHAHRVIRVTIDSVATGNMIHHSTAKHLECTIIPSAQSVQQADGSSQLQVVGEIQTTFTHDSTDRTFEGLVIVDLDVKVLAGTPFMEANDVAVCPAKREVLLGNGSTYTYGSKAPPSPLPAICRVFVLHAPTPPKTVWPGEFWRYSNQTTLFLIESMHLSPILTHLVYVIPRHPNCGRSPLSFPVLCGQYAYQTCHPSLKRLSSTSTSARSSNIKKSHR